MKVFLWFVYTLVLWSGAVCAYVTAECAARIGEGNIAFASITLALSCLAMSAVTIFETLRVKG